MELERVKGNTYVLKSWELIPLYRIDEHCCILLDTGTVDQREELDAALQEAGLTVVGIVGSHAHMDHMGSYGYYQSQGAKLALTLGETGQIFSSLSLHLQYYNLNVEAFADFPEIGTAPCLPDRIIMPGEEEVTLCGVTFGLVRTPGHTVDHICVRTPDDVLYVGDAMMTGRVLHHSKFPYAFCMRDYLDSLTKLRREKAACYIVAHRGVYTELLPFIDLELRFLTERMLELLDLVGDSTTPKEMTAAICETYHLKAGNVRHLAYFEQASQTYLHYLVGQGHLEAYIQEDTIRYRRTGKRPEPQGALPAPGAFRWRWETLPQETE